MNTIETHNIRKNFGTKIALDGISIHIPQNEICGLLGPNGAGKTTLMRILTRILQPDDGSILFNNRTFCDKDMAHIGYLPEERGLYSSMKIAEQLIFLARLKGVSRSEAKQRTLLWLEKFGLDNRARHNVGSLSKGLQQKIQFIGAIICSPRLLILDEPFNGLDPISTAFMREEIVTLQKQGTTILLSTHNLNEASTLCSNVVFINDARVRWQGKLSDLRKQYSSSCYRFTTEQAITLREEPDMFSVIETSGLEHIVKKNDMKTVSELLSFLSREYPLSRFEEKEVRLQEIFTNVVMVRSENGGTSHE